MITIYNTIKRKGCKVLALGLMLAGSGWVKAQTNIAPAAVANHSGGGSAAFGFGPSNYNDRVISPGIFGWVATTGNPTTTTSWIEYTWPTAQRIQRIRIFNDGIATRALAGGTIQVWNGVTYVNVMNFNTLPPGPQLTFDIILPTFQTTTRLRITNLYMYGSQNSNPAIREIEVYEPFFWDANVSSLTAPDICAGVKTLTATVTNNSRTAIDSVRFGFSVNGVVQFNNWIKQRLVTGASTTINFNHNFTTSGVQTLRAFTSLPNNRTDTFVVNDTFRISTGVFVQPGTTSVIDQSQCGSGFPLHRANKVPGKTIWFNKYYNIFPLAVGDSVRGKTRLFPNGTSAATYTFDAITHNGVTDTFSTNIVNTWSFTGGATPQQKGYFFNVTPRANLLFTGFDASITDASQASYDVEVYYRLGSYNGFETSSAGWVSCGRTTITNGLTQTGTVRQPIQRIDINDMYLLNGQTYGFYMVVLNASANLRTNCESTLASTSNNYVTLSTGTLSAAGLFSFTNAFGYRPEIRLHIEPGCASTTPAVQTITVKPLPTGARAVASTPYKSSRLNTPGSLGSPDIVAHKDTISYELLPPTGYTNAGHNTTWKITGLVARTRNGFTVPAGNYTIADPTATSNAKLWFHPLSNMVDSLVNVQINFQDLGPHNCDSTVQRWIRIAPRAKVNFKFNSSICDGKDAIFENLSTVSSGSMEYKWYFGDGDSSDARDPVYRYKGPGTYQVKLVVKTLPFGYVNDTTIALTVNPIPNVKFTKNNACEGQDLVFTNQTTPSTGINSTWNWGNGVTVANNNTTVRYRYASPGSYLVTLTVNLNGCIASASQRAYQFPTPKAAFDQTSGSCDNDAYTFKNKSTITSGTFGPYWNFGDNTYSTEDDASKVFGTPGSKSVKLIVTSVFGCKDSITKSINVLESPKVSFINTPACSRTATQFTNTTPVVAGAGGTVKSYNWNFGDGGTSILESPSRSWSTLGPKTVTFDIELMNGCKGSFKKDLNVGIQPKAAFTAQNVCLGKPMVFDNTSTWPQGDINWLWNFGDGTTSTSSKPVHTYNKAFSPNVTLYATITGGCTDSVVIPVTIFEGPRTCDFTVATDYAFGFHGVKLNPLNASTGVAGGQDKVDYTWIFQGGGTNKTSGVNAETQFDFQTDGTYDVTMRARSTTAPFCECSITKKVVMNRAAVKDLETTGVAVFPNPNNGQFNLSVKSSFGKNLNIVITNMSGAVVKQISAENNGLININSGNLSDGVYMVRVSSGDNTAVRRITISK